MHDDATREAGSPERAEFEAVLTAFSNTPRSVRLLRYIGEKYFTGDLAELCEYSIATEVFERSKAIFDPAQDAIARAETHRLRKRLRDYYSGEGKNHSLQLSLPPATYVPVFIPMPQGRAAEADITASPVTGDFQGGEDPDEEEETLEEQGRVPAVAEVVPAPRFRARALIATSVVLIIALLSIVAVVRFRREHRVEGRADSFASPGTAAIAAPVGSGSGPIRLLAGYSGSPQIDSAGGIWTADRYFSAGGTGELPPTEILKTTSPFIFEHWRRNNFSYDIPLKPGVYELHLFFITTDPPASERTFSVTVNGKKVLTSFDIDSDAFGRNIADERVFRDIGPASDGLLHITLEYERGMPLLSAIEILPGIPHRQLPIRLVVRNTPYMDHTGQFWRPDDYFMEGHVQTKQESIAGTADPDLFASERYGHFSYTVPVDPRGRYTVVLHFTELYFGTKGPDGGGVGSRVFRVRCNGELLLDNFDIYKETGRLHALTKTFYHLKPTEEGKLELMFEPIRNNATISSIEVLDESR